MGLKRKRSGSGLSPSSNFSDSSRDSSSPCPSQSECVMSGGDLDMTDTCFAVAQINVLDADAESSLSHLHSRTRKRFRDNRPEENVIYENTYQKLFQAQRAAFAHPVPAYPRPASVPPTAPQKQCQTSLHNFWALPRRPSTSHSLDSALQPQFRDLERSQKCEDCDASLAPVDDCAMEIDGSAGSEHQCRHCRRLVCQACSVQYVGDDRECLQCRTSPKRWVGGIGWM